MTRPAAPHHAEPEHARSAPPPRPRRPRAHAHLTLDDVTLPDEAAAVRDALLAVAGTLAVRIDLALRRAIVTYDPRITLPDRLTDAVNRAVPATHHPYHARITHIDTRE